MRSYDLSPLYRSTVGFDRLFSFLDQSSPAESSGYPPYNIEKIDDNTYQITVAVAGFSDKELTIVAQENSLTIKGSKETRNEKSSAPEVLYQGIAARGFERRYQLADHVQVVGARLQNGLLHVQLVREIPEARKPRQISIGVGETFEPKVEENAGASVKNDQSPLQAAEAA